MPDVVKVYSEYDPPPKPVLAKFEKTLTRDSEAKDCDVNVIMARYEKTGMLPVDNRQAFFADVSEMGDYRSALHQVKMADEFFMSLPAKVRSRFDNDPAAFLDFVSDPASRDEMVELGLLEKPKASEGPAPGAPEVTPAA